MSEKFIQKESSSSVMEKVNTYPKAGLILRTNSRKQSRENDNLEGGNIGWYPSFPIVDSNILKSNKTFLFQSIAKLAQQFKEIRKMTRISGWEQVMNTLLRRAKVKQNPSRRLRENIRKSLRQNLHHRDHS